MLNYAVTANHIKLLVKDTGGDVIREACSYSLRERPGVQ